MAILAKHKTTTQQLVEDLLLQLKGDDDAVKLRQLSAWAHIELSRLRRASFGYDDYEVYARLLVIYCRLDEIVKEVNYWDSCPNETSFSDYADKHGV